MRRLPALVLALFAAHAAGQANVQKSDWELEQERRNPANSALTLPAYPKAGGLIEFGVSSASSFRFFVDPASLSVEQGVEVRYTLVARSSSGVANVSYEGIRCEKDPEYRVYALGNDGRWSVRDSEWRRIEARSIQRWHNELYRRYFCPNDALIRTAAEGVDALRRGGHHSVLDSGLR